MLEFEQTTIKFKFEGKEYSFACPRFGKVKEMRKRLRDGEDEIEVMYEFFKSCGVNPKVLDRMEYGQLLELLKAVNGQKKS